MFFPVLVVWMSTLTFVKWGDLVVDCNEDTAREMNQLWSMAIRENGKGQKKEAEMTVLGQHVSKFMKVSHIFYLRKTVGLELDFSLQFICPLENDVSKILCWTSIIWLLDLIRRKGFYLWLINRAGKGTSKGSWALMDTAAGKDVGVSFEIVKEWWGPDCWFYRF